MKAIPSAGTVTVPDAVSPGSAAIFVPSAKVTSWGEAPVLSKVTSYVPAAGTVTSEGVNPRSNALISIASPVAAALVDGLGRLDGCAAAAVATGAGAYDQPPVVAVVQPIRSTAMAVTAVTRRTLRGMFVISLRPRPTVGHPKPILK